MSTVPDHSLDRRSPRMETLRRRHELSVIGYQFEQYLETSENPTWEQFVEQANLPTLPERYTVTLQRLVERHVEQRRATADAEQTLIEHSVLDPEADGQTNGRELYQARTGHDSRGTIYFKNMGTHFLLCFSHKTDVGDFFDTDSFEFEDLNGSFMWNHSFRLADFGIDSDLDIEIPMIRVYDVKVTSTQELMRVNRRTYSHEKQHEINREFGVHRIVDEMLARVRDGSDGSSLAHTVNTEYDRLFENMSEDEASTAHGLVTEFGDAFAELGDRLPYPETRAVLVNGFLDVTLEQLPTRARAMTQLYKQLLDGIPPDDARTINRNMIPEEIEYLVGTVYPRTVHEQLQAMADAVHSALSDYDDIHKPVVINRVCNRVPVEDTDSVAELQRRHAEIFSSISRFQGAYRDLDVNSMPMSEYVADQREQDFVFTILDYLQSLDQDERSEFCSAVLSITEDLRDFTADIREYSGSEETGHLFLAASNRERIRRDELEATSPRIQAIRTELSASVVAHEGEHPMIHFRVSADGENQVECLVMYERNGKFHNLKAFLPIMN